MKKIAVIVILITCIILSIIGCAPQKNKSQNSSIVKDDLILLYTSKIGDKIYEGQNARSYYYLFVEDKYGNIKVVSK